MCRSWPLAVIVMVLLWLPAGTGAAPVHCHGVPAFSIVFVGSQHDCVDANTVIQDLLQGPIAFRPGLHRHAHPATGWACDFRVAPHYVARYNHDVAYAHGQCRFDHDPTFDFNFSGHYA